MILRSVFNIYVLLLGRMESLVLLLIIALISITSSTINVVYLRGVPRLNNSIYWDYYFGCNTVGLTLQWQVNGNPLGGFLTGEVARTLSSTRSNFNYTTTLLSSQPTTGVQSTFDSVLIVSLLGWSSLDVTCRNGPSFFKSVNNTESKRDVENNTNTSSINLELLLAQPIVIAINHTTSVFVCGVSNQFLIWQINTDIYAFTILDSIGQSRQTLKQNGSIVKEQGILIAHEPYPIVSVFFVTHTSDISVRCGYNQDFLQLVSTTALEDPSAETDPEPITTVASSKLLISYSISELIVE